MNNNLVYDTYSNYTKCTVFIFILKQIYHNRATVLKYTYCIAAVLSVQSIIISQKIKKNMELLHPEPIQNFTIRIKNEKIYKIRQVDYKVGIWKIASYVHSIHIQIVQHIFSILDGFWLGQGIKIRWFFFDIIFVI